MVKDYIADHYGTCSLEACLCIELVRDKEGFHHAKRPWMGRGCPNWTPVGQDNWKDLVDAAARDHTVEEGS